MLTGTQQPGSPVRWGILATGAIAEAFTRDLMALPSARITAVASRSPQAAEAFAGRYGIGTAYGSWQALADDPDVDLVYVATPHSAHHAASALCLRAGKAVLCEKPLTLDAASALDLISIAGTHNAFLMEAMWMRVNPVVRRVHELVVDGAIGEVTHVHASFGVPGPFPVGHRMRDPALGGGALLDLGVYAVSLAHLFLGVPESVTAWAHLTPERTDQNTAVVLGYRSGAVATLHCGFVGDTAQRATITGTAGRIEVHRAFYRPDRFTLSRTGEEPLDVQLSLWPHEMAYQAQEAMRCVRAGLRESPLVPHQATVDVMRILDEARYQIGVVYPHEATT